MVDYVWLHPHAIAEGQPSVDVYLSQEHCLYFDDKGVPDTLLADVGSIMLEREVAGGLPEETYQDTGIRGPLSNAGEPVLPDSTISVNEDMSRWVTGAGAGAPLAAEADKVEAIPSHLAKQSEEPGYVRAAAQTSRDAEVRLVADGAAIRPVVTSGGIYSFVVPRNVRSVSLESRFAGQTDAVPPQKADTSRRGVSVVKITIRSDAGEVVIPADDPRLTSGWHDAERGGSNIWRWTDGAAQLPWTNVAGPAVVVVHCSTRDEYPICDGIPAADLAISSTDSVASHRDGPVRSQLFASGITPNPAPPEAGKAVRIQWCPGMYSSGSTWAFNAIRSVGKALFPGQPHSGVYAESVDQLPPGWVGSDRLIIKSHHADETASALLLQHADRIWITIRDPRDCVASASTYMFPDFDSALVAVTRSALYCEGFILDPRCVLLRYEDGFIDDPATLDRFAAAVSRTLTPQDRDRLFQQTRRKAIETLIKGFDPNETVDDGFPGHRVDMETQWHTHHVNRTGEVGRWRHTLDPAQATEVQRRLGPWMERFGYQS